MFIQTSARGFKFAARRRDTRVGRIDRRNRPVHSIALRTRDNRFPFRGKRETPLVQEYFRSSGKRTGSREAARSNLRRGTDFLATARWFESLADSTPVVVGQTAATSRTTTLPSQRLLHYCQSRGGDVQHTARLSLLRARGRSAGRPTPSRTLSPPTARGFTTASPVKALHSVGESQLSGGIRATYASGTVHGTLSVSCVRLHVIQVQSDGCDTHNTLLPR